MLPYLGEVLVRHLDRCRMASPKVNGKPEPVALYLSTDFVHTKDGDLKECGGERCLQG